MLVALPLIAVVVALLPAVGGAADAKPQATEIGVDATTIHIAKVADVDNAIAPGLFKGGVDGATGAVKYINANGGIAGRKLVLDFYDSKLNPERRAQRVHQLVPERLRHGGQRARSSSGASTT